MGPESRMLSARTNLRLAAVLVSLGLAALFGKASAGAPADKGTEAPANRPAPAPHGSRLPFDIVVPTPHGITAIVDTAPARNMLALLKGGADAPAALRSLKSSAGLAQALRQQGLNPDDFFGRLVAAAAGTPDPLLASYSAKADSLHVLLDELDKEGGTLVEVEAQRIASLLPKEPAVTAQLALVPFFSVAGFADVMSVREGDRLTLVAELSRIAGEGLGSDPPREILLKVIRSASAEAWLQLFDFHFRKPPIWPEQRDANFETLLARTIAEGPATLFLFPDEFFPISGLFEAPIAVAFAKWNRAVEALADPKKKESERNDIVTEASRGDFWGRYTAIVGAEIAEVMIHEAGREQYLRALSAGPRAVATLYLTVTKGKKTPTFGKSARKELERTAPTPRP